MNAGQIGVVALAAAVIGGTAWAGTSLSNGGRDYVGGVVTLNEARAEDVDGIETGGDRDLTDGDDGTNGGDDGGPYSIGDSAPGTKGTRDGATPARGAEVSEASTEDRLRSELRKARHARDGWRSRANRAARGTRSAPARSSAARPAAAPPVRAGGDDSQSGGGSWSGGDT